MPYYMDRHELPGVTAADLAQAHLQDLEVQDKFGVRYLSYWFDYDRHTAFCLVDAPDEEKAIAVHAASHGLVPNQIIPVEPATVEMFLGRIVDPTESGVTTPGFRAIMFTDLEGSTDFTQRLGDDGAMEILRRHDALIRTALHTHRGSEVKHTGDGIMASFASVSDALNCAIAIQQAIADHNSARDPGEQFHVRIGIAAGEPVTERGDLFGAAVQLAARLCNSAQAGQICVAATVRDLAIGKRFTFSDPIELPLKGFDQPVRAAHLLWQERPGAS